MQLFDQNVPKNLLAIQSWFASIITRPIDHNSQMMALSPSNQPMAEEAARMIAPSLKLSADQRIQIYNQQYWWRLLKGLHENFPGLTALFGYDDFNCSIGMPFLTRHLPHHWSLSKLGDRLSAWLDETYAFKDKPLVLSMAEVDWAHQELFFAPRPEKLVPTADLLSKKLALQPHIQLFQLPFDLLTFRKALVQEAPEFWLEADFPPLVKERRYHFFLYRNEKICYEEVQEGEWTLLNLIASGLTIEAACDYLEEAGGEAYTQAKTSCSQWIQRWLQYQWLIVRD